MGFCEKCWLLARVLAVGRIVGESQECWWLAGVSAVCKSVGGLQKCLPECWLVTRALVITGGVGGVGWHKRW